MTSQLTGYTVATPKGIEALKARCKGKSGGGEAEVVLHWCRMDAREGYVEVTAAGRLAIIAKIITRCGSAVLGWREATESVTLRVALRNAEGRNVFRGVPGAFAPIDVKSEARPDFLNMGEREEDTDDEDPKQDDE